MAQTISGYQTTPQSLATSSVLVAGTINAYGSIPGYVSDLHGAPLALDLDAALLGAAPTAFSLTNIGLIESRGTGGNRFDFGIVLGAPGTVNNAGTIQAASGIAIFGETGASYIDNSGSIEGSLGAGIVLFGGPGSIANSGSIDGAQYAAIALFGGGLVRNNAGGVLSGGQYAIDAEQRAAQAVNAGTLMGFDGGIQLSAGGVAENTGLILATGAGNTYFYGGIRSGDGGTVENAGTIFGQNGIAEEYGTGNGTLAVTLAGTIGNAGTIDAISRFALLGTIHAQPFFGVGIALDLPGSVVNSGVITASNAGIFTQAYDSDATSITNTSAGRIVSAHYGVYLQGPNGALSNAGQITGVSAGLLALGQADLLNAGIIASTGTSFALGGNAYGAGAAGLLGGGTVTNLQSGTITAVEVALGGGRRTGIATTLINAGLVEASGTQVVTIAGLAFAPIAVDLLAGGAVLNQQGGSISGQEAGIVFEQSFGQTALVENAGLIQAPDALIVAGGETFGSDGIVLVDGGTVENAKTGVITAENGVVTDAGGSIENDGVITAGELGVFALGNAASRVTVSNAGTIQMVTGSFALDGTTYPAIGVEVENAGTFVNQSGGLVAGNFGVFAGDDGTALAGGAFSNAGIITGNYAGADLNLGGYAGNSGTISGLRNGLVMYSNPAALGTIENDGVISAPGTLYPYGNMEYAADGVFLSGGGTLDNQASGQISGAIGAILVAQGTLINAGTISGLYGVNSFAAYLEQSGDRVIVDPGAVFHGLVYDKAGDGALELAAGNGVLSGIGSAFYHFQTLAFDPGAAWRVSGDVAGFDEIDSVTGFGLDDTVTIDGFVANGYTFAPGVGLELSGFSGTAAVDATLALPGTLAAGDFLVTVDGGATTIVETIATCFCPGTRIATKRGAVPVEALRVGETVLTRDAGEQKILWIGRRGYEGRFIAGNPLMLPVRIRAGAIAAGVPGRELVVSPGHGVWVGGALVPAWRLVNGVSITQDMRVERVEYFHIELPGHELVLAEGCAAESFYDDGCRGQFRDSVGGSAASGAGLARVESGFGLEAIQLRLGLAGGGALGRVRGFVDRAGPGVVSGWAWAGGGAVCLDVKWQGRRVARVLANFYRADLREAGWGRVVMGLRWWCRIG